MKDISQDEFECPYCGAIHKGSLKYCPNCHERQVYEGDIKTINNEPDNQEEYTEAGLKGCGCIVIGAIIFSLWSTFFLQ